MSTYGVHTSRNKRRGWASQSLKDGGMVKHQPLGGTLNKEMYEMVFVMLSMLWLSLLK